MTTSVIVHENPVWREHADFIISAEVNPPPDATRWQWEQLWARQIDESRFVLCCIPFFVYGLALGDEVETGPSKDRKYVVQRVVKLSGHRTFRVWFYDLDARDEVTHKLTNLGCLMEWRWKTGNLLAVDTPSARQAQIVADYLWQWEQQGLLVYETGQIE
jgi:hypothetical protein